MKTRAPIEAGAVAPQSGCSYPEPFKSRMGEMSWRPLGDEFGLSQFGISLETLGPALNRHCVTGIHWMMSLFMSSPAKLYCATMTVSFQ